MKRNTRIMKSTRMEMDAATKKPSLMAFSCFWRVFMLPHFSCCAPLRHQGKPTKCAFFGAFWPAS